MKIIEAPKPNASFKEMLEYFLKIKNLTFFDLVERSGIVQSELHKIINNNRKNVPVDKLVCICLALNLTLERSIDLLARKERNFSPANPLHEKYKYYIDMYSEEDLTYISEDSARFEVDVELYLEGFPVLPCADIDEILREIEERKNYNII